MFLNLILCLYFSHLGAFIIFFIILCVRLPRIIIPQKTLITLLVLRMYSQPQTTGGTKLWLAIEECDYNRHFGRGRVDSMRLLMPGAFENMRKSLVAQLGEHEYFGEVWLPL